MIERDFELLADSRETHERWRALLVQHNVQGVQVHDARLAASMYVHGIGQLLTMNYGTLDASTGALRSVGPKVALEERLAGRRHCLSI